jgi:hypothetical protein
MRPPTGLLFVPQVIKQHGRPRWNDVGKGRFLIRPRELSGNSTNSHVVAKRKKLGKGYDEFGLTKYLCSYRTCRKILQHGADGFTSPPKEGVLRNYIALKIHRPLPDVNQRTLGSNGKAR